MRNLRFVIALVALVFLSYPVVAQSYTIKVTAAKVGLPAGRFTSESDDATGQGSYIAKSNMWTPVYVQLEVMREEKRSLAIVVETSDPDDLGAAYAVPLQNLSDRLPGTKIEPTELSYLPYIRTNGRSELTVSVREIGKGNPAEWRSVSEPLRSNYIRSRDTSHYVVLSLGTNLAGFTLPKEEVDDANPGTTRKGLRGGRIETAAITDVAMMPDQWFGYDSADLVVLTTGAADVNNFLTPLFTSPTHRHRLEALFEWVRRGGRLVVSVGSNVAIVKEYPLLQELLPVEIRRDNPSEPVKELTIEWALPGTNKRLLPLATKQGTMFPLCNFTPKPDRGFRQMIPPSDDESGTKRAMVQGAYGMGRVTLVGFDLDRSPFTDYAGRADFWDLLLREAGSPRASLGSGIKTNINYNTRYDSEDEFANRLRSHIDTFAGVPVISFGWVALFIVMYTLLIGPIEYFILKKVFKRLELTWITFPIIVLTVSTIAYFTAYALKGSDLKVNKIDLIDIDASTNRVYGRTWFTIFSPRREDYRIGIEPSDGWVNKTSEQPGAGALIDWVGGARSGKSSFFRRSYYYQIDTPGNANRLPFGDGIVDVPIQVWSTKAFAADWSAPIEKANPLIVSDLIHPPSDKTTVSGSFVANLPFKEIRDVYLIYAGKAYKYDNPITPGTKVNVVLIGKDDPDWLNAVDIVAGTSTLASKKPNTPGTVTGNPQLFRVMFHDEIQKTNDSVAPENATLRRIDQSWRLSDQHRDELILVGKLAPTREASAEAMFTETNSASPTKLWLKDLPGKANARLPQQGTLQQETYVRAYIPIRPNTRK